MSRDVAADKNRNLQRWNLPDLGECSSGYSGRNTVNDLEECRQQAYREGYDLGRSEGQEAGRQGMAEQAMNLKKLMHSMTRPLDNLDQKVEEELLKLVFAIVRQLVGHEVGENPGYIATVVHEAVSVLPAASRNLQIYLHPEDVQLVHELLPGQDSETRWHLCEDLSVERGGCRVVTESSQVDATVNARLDNIIALLFGDASDEGVSG